MALTFIKDNHFTLFKRLFVWYDSWRKLVAPPDRFIYLDSPRAAQFQSFWSIHPTIYAFQVKQKQAVSSLFSSAIWNTYCNRLFILKQKRSATPATNFLMIRYRRDIKKNSTFGKANIFFREKNACYPLREQWLLTRQNYFPTLMSIRYQSRRKHRDADEIHPVYLKSFWLG